MTVMGEKTGVRRGGGGVPAHVTVNGETAHGGDCTAKEGADVESATWTGWQVAASGLDGVTAVLLGNGIASVD